MATESTKGTLPTFEPLEDRMFLSASLYVATSGNDANPGTFDAPFATLARAQTAVRNLKTSGLPTGGVTVYIRGGKYTQTTTLSFTSSDSGTSDKPIVWTAYNNEPVEITGGVKLDPSWFSTVTSSSPIWSRVNTLARGNLMQVDLKAHGITDFGSLVKRSTWKWSGNSPLELFFEGDRMQLGRYPNVGFTKTVTAPSSSSFTYTDSRMDTWSSANDVWFYGFFGTLWESANVNGTINTSTNTVTLSAAPQYGVKANMPYFAYNILEEVDSPGEYYLDRSSGMLYFWAPSSISDKSIYASMLKSNILSLSSTSYVTFSGLTFEMSRAGLVSISGGSHNTLENCILRDAGGNGAIITGAANGLDHCQVYEIGDMAVSLDGGTRSTLTAAGNFVRNTSIHDYGQWVGTNRQGIAVHGVGQVVAHNEIYNGPDAAIQFWGNNHLFEYNDIHDVCRTLNDGGAIYSGRDWSYQGNVLRYNFIHDIQTTWKAAFNSSGSDLYGIYLDDAMSQVDIYGSIFYNIGGSAIFSAGGRDNHITNNIFSNNYTGILADRRGMDIINNISGSDCNFLQKLNNAAGGDFHAGAWASAYPNLQIIPNDFASLGSLKDPGGSKLVGNIGYMNTKGFKREGSWGGYTGAFSYWASVTNNIENADPQFVNPSGGDFNVKSTSPVHSIAGWQNIPFDQIGIEASDVPPPPPVADGSVVVDNKDAGFAAGGTWNESGAADEYNGSSVTSMNVGDWATWTPNLPKAGMYDVFAWWSDKKSDGTTYSRDTAAQYTVNYSGGAKTIAEDQNKNSGQWVKLGTFSFDGGVAGSVKLVRAGANGSATCADAVEFVYSGTANQPPVAKDDTLSLNQDTSASTPNVLANDSDPDGDVLAITAFTQAQHGTVANNNNGTFKYTPAAGYVGTDVFSYTISDGKGGTATANVNVTVLAVNRPPVANPDVLSLNQDTSANTPNVLANDTDPDGDVLTVSTFTQPLHGTAANNIDGTFKYTPAAGYTGPDVFSYTVSDGHGGTAAANVNVTVLAVNHAPVANADTVTTNQDTAVTTCNVLANDTDPDGDALAVSAFTQAGHGSVVNNKDGTFKYTPAAGYVGSDVFSYTVSDGKGGSATANVNVTVLAVNHAPVANADSATTKQDTAVTTCNVLANDSDPDGDTLSVSAFTQASHGTVVNNNNGTFTYTPAAGYSGTDSFTYTVSDGHGGTASAPVNLTITAVVPPPPTSNEIVVDNLDKGFSTTGKWSESGASDEYAGSSVTAMTVGATARWTPLLPAAGGYKVYVWYSDKKSDGTAYVRDSAANYTVKYSGGSQTFNVNQNANSGQWVLLGTFNFDWGNAGYVEVLRDANDGVSTCADAVKFVPVPTTDIIVDNKGAGFTSTGTWNESAASDEYAGSSVTSMNVGDKARWTPTLPQAGTYNVYVWYSDKKSDGTLYSRDAAAAYTVTYKGGTKTFSINQNVKSGQWVLLGSFQFDAGTSGFVDLLRSANSGISTCADAVRFSLVQ